MSGVTKIINEQEYPKAASILVLAGGGWRKLVWKNETNFASWARRARDAKGRGFSNQLVSPS